MTKQEEIREGLKAELEKHLYLPIRASVESKLGRDRAIEEFLKNSLQYLHSQGVVLLSPVNIGEPPLTRNRRHYVVVEPILSGH